MFSRSLAAMGIAAFLAAAPDAAVGSKVRSCIVEDVEGDSARYWQGGIWSNLWVALALSPEAQDLDRAGNAGKDYLRRPDRCHHRRYD